MKDIELLIDAEMALAKSQLLRELSGHFGNRIADDIHKELRERAEKQYKNFEMFNKKVVNHLK